MWNRLVEQPAGEKRRRRSEQADRNRGQDQPPDVAPEPPGAEPDDVPDRERPFGERPVERVAERGEPFGDRGGDPSALTGLRVHVLVGAGVDRQQRHRVACRLNLAQQRAVVELPPVVAERDQARPEARRARDGGDRLLVGQIPGRARMGPHLDPEREPDERTGLDDRLAPHRIEQLAERIGPGSQHGADRVVAGGLGGVAVLRLLLQPHELVDVRQLLVDEFAFADRPVEHLEAEPERGILQDFERLLRIEVQVPELVAQRADPRVRGKGEEGALSCERNRAHIVVEHAATPEVHPDDAGGARRLALLRELQGRAGGERELVHPSGRRRFERFGQPRDPGVHQRRDSVGVLRHGCELAEAGHPDLAQDRPRLRHAQEPGPESVSHGVESEAALARENAEKVRALADRLSLVERHGEEQQPARDHVPERVWVVEKKCTVRAAFDELALVLDAPRLLGELRRRRHDHRLPDLHDRGAAGFHVAAGRTPEEARDRQRLGGLEGVAETGRRQYRGPARVVRARAFGRRRGPQVRDWFCGVHDLEHDSRAQPDVIARLDKLRRDRARPEPDATGAVEIDDPQAVDCPLDASMPAGDVPGGDDDVARFRLPDDRRVLVHDVLVADLDAIAAGDHTETDGRATGRQRRGWRRCGWCRFGLASGRRGCVPGWRQHRRRHGLARHAALERRRPDTKLLARPQDDIADLLRSDPDAVATSQVDDTQALREWLEARMVTRHALVVEHERARGVAPDRRRTADGQFLAGAAPIRSGDDAQDEGREHFQLPATSYQLPGTN